MRGAEQKLVIVSDNNIFEDSNLRQQFEKITSSPENIKTTQHNNEKMIDDIDNICRLCLGKDNLLDIFSEYSSFPERILEITTLKVNLDDKFPKKICFPCSLELEYITQFKLKCIETANILQISLLNLSKEKKEILESTEKTKKKIPILKKTRKKTFNRKTYNALVMKAKKLKAESDLSPSRDEEKLDLFKSEIEIERDTEDIITQKGNQSLIKSNPIKLIPKENDKSKRLTYVCHICGKFYELCKIQYHINAHNNIRPFVCNIEDCNKTFTSPFQLNGHKKICHTDCYRFECEICRKKFKIKSTFDIHKSYHSDPQIPCLLCGKLLRNKRAVKKHMMSHTNERPFPCNQCDKSFANRYNLKVHGRVHTKEKPFICSNCGEAFGYNSLLKSHTERHHPEMV